MYSFFELTRLRIIKIVSRLHVMIYFASRGKILKKLVGGSMCFVEMNGSKTNKLRIVPLLYIPYQSGAILVASQGGSKKNPQWYYNLSSNPIVVIHVQGKKNQATARLIRGTERIVMWNICLERYSGYQNYQDRTAREIPIFFLSFN